MLLHRHEGCMLETRDCRGEGPALPFGLGMSREEHLASCWGLWRRRARRDV